MTAKQLFSKTMPFVWAMLLLGLIFLGISILLFAILVGLGWLFGDNGMVIMFLVWLGAMGFVRFLIMHYFGYLLKAGHIAVIAEATATGKVPVNQVNYGKEKVKERFATSNVYFAVDKLVTAAVRQIQRGIGKLGDMLDFIPGMDAVTGLAQFFVNISLGYIDECCLGWTFRNPQDSAFKSAADGVVIYAQNWKVLLKNAAKTMLKTILLCIVAALIIFVPIGLIFKLLHWSGLAAFLIACVAAWVVKFAFMDSYIMIQMMASYMEVAPNTQITFDLYGKLCNISSKFKEMFDKGQQEQPEAAPAVAMAGSGYIPQQPIQKTAAVSQSQPITAKPVFCGQCGAKNEIGAKFCSECGQRMEE